MASTITSTLRVGTVSRLSGGGAFEKSSRGGGDCRLSNGGARWNGSKKSLLDQPRPNQPPPRCDCWRCSYPPKLKNCAEVGPPTLSNTPAAIASAISGPLP